jgi:hypothetical protein
VFGLFAVGLGWLGLRMYVPRRSSGVQELQVGAA